VIALILSFLGAIGFAVAPGRVTTIALRALIIMWGLGIG
jgi:hypothetical protein